MKIYIKQRKNERLRSPAYLLGIHAGAGDAADRKLPVTESAPGADDDSPG